MLNAYLQSLIFDINSDIESIQFEALKTISIIPNSELPNKEFLIFHLFNHIIYSKNEGVKYQSRVALCKLVGIKDKFNECSIQNMDSENFEYFINDLSPKRFLSVFLNENFSALKTKFKTDIFDLFVKKLRNSDHVILEIFIIKILAVLPASKKTRLDMITPFLQNENPFILASTIETLGRIKYIESVNKILNFITNDNPLVSLTAFKALQNINSKIIFTCVREIAASQAEHIDEKIKFIFSELTMNTELLTCIYMNLLLEKNNQVIETLLPIFLKFINQNNFELFVSYFESDSKNRIEMKIKDYVFSKYGSTKKQNEIVKKAVKPVDIKKEKKVIEKKESKNIKKPFIVTPSQKKQPSKTTKPVYNKWSKKSTSKNKPETSSNFETKSFLKVKQIAVIAILIFAIPLLIYNYNLNTEIAPVATKKVIEKDTLLKSSLQKNHTDIVKFPSGPKRNIIVSGTIREVLIGKTSYTYIFMKQGKVVFRFEILKKNISEPLSIGANVSISGIVKKCDKSGCTSITCKEIILL